MKQFIDVAKFEIEAGHGGAGSVSFRHEAHVPMGGPDGGNGGDGGDVIVVVDPRVNSFGKIKSRKKFRAKDGEVGRGKLSEGKRGEDITIRVPIGTVIYNDEDDSIIADLVEEGQRHVLVKGGKGGKGNKFYATSTNQAPDYAQHGLPGEKLNIRFEVKLIADIGLVGMPNAGKSSLLSRLTRANPKIAPYPFTTLTPNLGVCYIDHDRSFIIADIPGIIEGAHEGAGLGLTFLRHIERTGALAFIIDITDEDICDTYKKLYNELKLYSKELVKKKSIIVLNKIDMLEDNEIEIKVSKFKKMLEKKKDIPKIFTISTYNLQGDTLEKLTNSFYNANKNRYTDNKNHLQNINDMSVMKKIKHVFGPVRSKRLGNSLGIDVIPHKTCSYNCIYCQLGKEENTTTETGNFYSADEIIFELREALHNHKNIDYITFTGSGEPTLYSDLKRLIYEIKQMTDIPICLITNGAMLYKQEIRSSLLLADVVIPSLDAGNYDTFKIINQPNKDIDFEKMVNGLIEFRRIFKGKYWLEVFIIKNVNDSKEEIDDIVKIVDRIKPDKVQLITATRRCAYKDTKAVSINELEDIKKHFKNIPVEIPQVDMSNEKNDKSITEDEVLDALIRQPDTAAILAAGFQVDEENIQNILNKLIEKGKIRNEIVNGIVSYFAVL